jgi:hypothetical protein
MAELSRQFLMSGPASPAQGMSTSDISAGAISELTKAIDKLSQNNNNELSKVVDLLKGDKANTEKVVQILTTLREDFKQAARDPSQKGISPELQRNLAEALVALKNIGELKELTAHLKKFGTGVRDQAFSGKGAIGIGTTAGATAIDPGLGLVVKAMQENYHAIKETAILFKQGFELMKSIRQYFSPHTVPQRGSMSAGSGIESAIIGRMLAAAVEAALLTSAAGIAYAIGDYLKTRFGDPREKRVREEYDKEHPGRKLLDLPGLTPEQKKTLSQSPWLEHHRLGFDPKSGLGSGSHWYDPFTNIFGGTSPSTQEKLDKLGTPNPRVIPKITPAQPKRSLGKEAGIDSIPNAPMQRRNPSARGSFDTRQNFFGDITRDMTRDFPVSENIEDRRFIPVDQQKGDIVVGLMEKQTQLLSDILKALQGGNIGVSGGGSGFGLASLGNLSGVGGGIGAGGLGTQPGFPGSGFGAGMPSRPGGGGGGRRGGSGGGPPDTTTTTPDTTTTPSGPTYPTLSPPGTGPLGPSTTAFTPSSQPFTERIAPTRPNPAFAPGSTTRPDPGLFSPQATPTQGPFDPSKITTPKLVPNTGAPDPGLFAPPTNIGGTPGGFTQAPSLGTSPPTGPNPTAVPGTGGGTVGPPAFSGTYPTEAELRDKSRAAGERFNNPFNMWYDKYAKGEGGLEGRKITQYDTPSIFPSKMAGAAAAIRKMAESPLYSGKTMQDLIKQWVGHGESYAPIISKMTGIPTNTKITPEFLKTDQGLAFLKAMSRYETRVSEPYHLTDAEWRVARDRALHPPGSRPQAGKPTAPGTVSATQAPGSQPAAAAGTGDTQPAVQPPGKTDARITSPGTERFKTVGNYQLGGDSRRQVLIDAAREASKHLPEGYRVEAYSGQRPVGRQGGAAHTTGAAVDFRIIGPDGKMIPNYQSPENYRMYETLHQDIRSVLQEKNPQLAGQYRWGGYFLHGPGGYGVADLMHGDFAHSGMAAGGWGTGKTATGTMQGERAIPHGWDIAQSKPMGKGYRRGDYPVKGVSPIAVAGPPQAPGTQPADQPPQRPIGDVLSPLSGGTGDTGGPGDTPSPGASQRQRSHMHHQGFTQPEDLTITGAKSGIIDGQNLREQRHIRHEPGFMRALHPDQDQGESLPQAAGKGAGPIFDKHNPSPEMRRDLETLRRPVWKDPGWDYGPTQEMLRKKLGRDPREEEMEPYYKEWLKGEVRKANLPYTKNLLGHTHGEPGFMKSAQLHRGETTKDEEQHHIRHEPGFMTGERSRVISGAKSGVIEGVTSPDQSMPLPRERPGESTFVARRHIDRSLRQLSHHQYTPIHHDQSEPVTHEDIEEGLEKSKEEMHPDVPMPRARPTNLGVKGGGARASDMHHGIEMLRGQAARQQHKKKAKAPTPGHRREPHHQIQPHSMHPKDIALATAAGTQVLS